ncbi:glycosyltransferase family 2 protein [Clostridium sp.]|uniref:glycosyltransferase family 2 protein n=1 Tax=Clostridium sp. TaxID=1506 RepID=UPI0026288456|nr:glycosyltransferase family 2 protein [Clostridium sp.]
MKSIGIVICNYNKRDYVLQCIQSVLESKMQDFDLYLVDNASVDDSVEMIEKEYRDKVELIVNKENLGGSGGFNAGLRKALEKGYKYLMCIDNDVLLDEDAIGELYNFLETHDDVGMVGSKVYHMNNPDYVQQFGINIDFKDYCVESKYLNYFEDGTMPELVYCDSVAACSLMVRTSVVKEIGVMPEENFLYWDDTEWGYLCNLAGYKVASYGKSKVLHAMGAKKESENTFPTYYAWRNWILFFIKYTPEEKFEEMTRMFLCSIFNIVYEALYKGEKNKMKTIMYAYDDALHQVLGKASEGKIFELDASDEKLSGLITGKKKVFIKDNGFETIGQSLFEKMKTINHDLERVKHDNEYSDIHFTICDSIFTIQDLSLKTVYVDIYDSILSTEDDVLRVINYNYSKEAFIYAQQPLFLHMAKKIREK